MTLEYKFKARQPTSYPEITRFYFKKKNMDLYIEGVCKVFVTPFQALPSHQDQDQTQPQVFCLRPHQGNSHASAINNSQFTIYN